jgi:hypothetical protein
MGGVDLDPPPSASGDIAPELFMEELSREDTTSREDESDSCELEVMEQGEPKKLRIRGESRVPEERKEPKTQEAKTLIIPDGVG